MKYKDLPFAEMDKLYLEGLNPTSISRTLNISLSLTQKYFYEGGYTGPKRTKSQNLKIGALRAHKSRVERTGRNEYILRSA